MLLKRRDSLKKFFESLPVISRSYSKKDRFRDFKAVFGSEAGGRVLQSILAETEGLPIIEEDAESHAKLAYRAGKRSVGLWIVKTLNKEPFEEES